MERGGRGRARGASPGGEDVSDPWDSDTEDYSADRLYDLADATKEQNREALLSHDRVGEQGIPEGKGEDSESKDG